MSALIAHAAGSRHAILFSTRVAAHFLLLFLIVVVVIGGGGGGIVVGARRYTAASIREVHVEVSRRQQQRWWRCRHRTAQYSTSQGHAGANPQRCRRRRRCRHPLASQVQARYFMPQPPTEPAVADNAASLCEVAGDARRAANAGCC